MSEQITPQIVLIGAGGHGRDVLDAALAQGRTVLGFLDDDPQTWGARVNGVPVLGGLRWLQDHSDVHVVITVGSPAVKQKLARSLEQYKVQLASPIIHPTAAVSPQAHLSDGVVVFAGSAIQPQVKIGKCAAISTVSTVGHDTIIEDFVSCHPGVQIGGDVTVETGSFVGIGVTVLPRVRIGAWAVIGAGAVVTTDVPAWTTSVGVPARVIKWHDACDKSAA